MRGWKSKMVVASYQRRKSMKTKKKRYQSHIQLSLLWGDPYHWLEWVTEHRTSATQWSLLPQYPPLLSPLNSLAQTLGFQPWTSLKLRNWTRLQSPCLPNNMARNRGFPYCVPPPAECPETSLLALASRELLSGQSPSIGTKAQSLWTRVWILKRLTLIASGMPCLTNWTPYFCRPQDGLKCTKFSLLWILAT